jgi:DNA-binding CsgD family transcriptional regulator
VRELRRHRGTHVAAGAGGSSYAGPVELWMGIGDASLGRLDEAAASLREAHDTCERIGAPGFAVHAGAELGRVLARRGAPGDAAEVRSLVDHLAPVATVLGMAPWVDALDQLDRAATAARRAAEPLTARELQVAGLVADGLTNRAIAERLYLSERTAQNHVQHILTKLGLSNRTQIAGWYADR